MKTNGKNSVRITITTTKQVHAYLQSLVSMGLYGATVAEAAQQLVCEGLRTNLRSKRVALLESKAPEVETAA